MHIYIIIFLKRQSIQAINSIMRHDIHSILFINKQVKKNLKDKKVLTIVIILLRKLKNRLYLFKEGCPV